MSKIAIIMQTRMGSTRLPGKVMLSLAGKPVLEHLIERLKQVKGADEVIVATSSRKRDDVIVAAAQRLGVPYFRGSEKDVLKRYYKAAEQFEADNIIRVCSDCPVIDPGIISHMILKFKENQGHLHYLSNTLKRTYPRGLAVEIFTFSALKKAFNEAQKDYEREHVTPYIWQHPELFKLQNYEYHTDISHYRWTLDTPEDFELITKIYEALYQEGRIFMLNEILAFVEKHPELSDINAHIKQKPVESVE